MTLLTRRSALLGIGAALCAPAVVRAESLMRIVAPRNYLYLGKGAGMNYILMRGTVPADLNIVPEGIIWETEIPAFEYIPHTVWTKQMLEMLERANREMQNNPIGNWK